MSTPPAGRKPRTDAACNRDRVLEAARAQFAESGYDVQMSEVARAAGVGVGTLYRKFPTREDLIAAIAEQRTRDLVAAARERGLVGFLHHAGEVLAGDRGMSELIERALGSAEPRGEAGRALVAALTELTDRARADGAVGGDVTAADVNMVVCGLASVIRNAAGDWRRYLELALKGLA